MFTKRFTRIELDVRSCGVKIVECALAYLREGMIPEVTDVGPVYLLGDTFVQLVSA